MPISVYETATAPNVHTIIFDNGGEFSEHQGIAEALEAKTYFAHPYSSWE